MPALLVVDRKLGGDPLPLMLPSAQPPSPLPDDDDERLEFATDLGAAEESDMGSRRWMRRLGSATEVLMVSDVRPSPYAHAGAGRRPLSVPPSISISKPVHV